MNDDDDDDVKLLQIPNHIRQYAVLRPQESMGEENRGVVGQEEKHHHSASSTAARLQANKRDLNNSGDYK